MSVAGRCFVVLGAAGGIGSAVARALRGDGARLLLAGRSSAPLEALGTELDCPWRQLDATDFGQVDGLLAAAAELAGDAPAGVVNCVGSLLLKPAHRTSAGEWRTVVDANLGSAFAVVRAAAATMRNGGAVVLCSSAAAGVGLANHEAIAAAKAGVEGLVRAAAATYASRGLRFNAVAPGLVDTGLTAAIVGNDAAAEASRRMHALGRIGTPADVARAITWLVDPANDWLTGQVVGIDGGLAAVRPPVRA